jgi:hypothetical protein
MEPVATSTMWMSIPTPFEAGTAISRESGDHAGSVWSCNSSTSFRSPVPSGRTIQRSLTEYGPRRNAIHDESGDHDGA